MPPKKRGSEVQLARGRLKGVLQDLVAASDDEQSDESEKKAPPQRGRPPKRRKELEEAETTTTGPLHESYIMKLFDRSLDLAKYNENTPLYPICRAWIADQSNSNKSFRNQRTPSPVKREPGLDLLRDLKNGVIDEITVMPAGKKLDIPRIPSPVRTENSDTDGKSLSRDEILVINLNHWRTVRKKWLNQSKAHEQRYITSLELLEALYKG